MTKFLSLFTFVFLVTLSPAMAQENADAVLAEQGVAEEALKEPVKALQEDDYEERLNLSRKMHEIWPVRPKVETALDIFAEQIEPQERAAFKAAMRKAIKFKALEEASVDAMADIFSIKELEAMIAFYGSKEGRSVSHKTGDYEKALEPVLVEMIDKALLNVKFGSE